MEAEQTVDVREQEIEKAINSFLAEVKNPDPDYELVKKNETVTVWRKGDIDTGIHKIKFVGNIPYPQSLVYKVLFDDSLRRAWDTVIDYIKEAQVFPNGAKILYISTRSPVWGIFPRDFVHIRSERHPESHKKTDGKVILDISTTHKDHPDRANDGYVRAHTYVSGGLFETTYTPNIKTKQLDEGTLYTMVSQVDIKGVVPKIVVNSVSSKATSDWFDALCKACENYKNGTLKPINVDAQGAPPKASQPQKE